MSQKQRGLFVVATLLLSAILLSSCKVNLSNAPEATPTLISTSFFVSPFPSVENPMDMIEEFAKQTAAAQTAIASGGTPAVPGTVEVTTGTTTTGTTVTPQIGVTPTPTIGFPSTPTNVGVTSIVVVPTFTPGAGATSVPVGSRPASYMLMPGEFPYCIARRFDVNPDELLSLNGLSDGQIYYPNLTLKIPQSGNRFPAARALSPHPTTYSVLSSDETIYSVACKYGDVDPNLLASNNGLTVSADLTAGQALKIP